MRKIFSLLLIGLFSQLVAQQNLAVGLDNSVYSLLEHAELLGIIHKLPQARPYSKRQVTVYLEQIAQQQQLLSRPERDVFNQIYRRFRVPSPRVGESTYLESGRIALLDGDDLAVEFRNRFQFEERGALTNKEFSYHSLNLAKIGIAGDITPYFSYQVLGAFGLGNLNPGTFLPYTHTKERDGHTISVNQKDQSHVFEGSGWGVPLQFLGESNLSLFENRLQMGFNYYRRDFGPGRGNLLYSANARPAFGFDFRFRPSEALALNFSSVSLGGYLPSGNSSESSMLTVQQLELFPWNWLYLSVNTGVVWIKRLEPMYLVPFWPAIFTQMVTGDYDNLTLELSLALKFKYFKLYGSFFVDEVQPQKVKTLFSSVTQQFAFQAGAKVVVPVLPFSSARIQYTKIEPYTYTHYAQRNPFATPKDGPGRLNVSWMHDGENLGYPLQPNSDEWQVHLESMPLPAWKFFLTYRFIRHGDGDPKKGEIEGRTDSVYQGTKNYNGSSVEGEKGKNGGEGKIDVGIYTPEAYFNDAEISKNFLHDGPYEFIHSFALGASYRFPQLPVAVGLDYGFAYNTGPVDRGSKGEPETRHVLGLSIALFSDF